MKNKSQCQVIIFICLVLLSQSLMAENLEKIYQQLPGEISGWKKAEKSMSYNPGNLFEYINGGAELYVSYCFKKMIAFKYSQDQDDEIQLDIFDMGNSYNAFGIFAHSRETIDFTFGQGSEYGGGLLTFWKSRYYVSILAYPETSEKKQLIHKLGHLISDAIKMIGKLPPVISLLPEENLIEESIRYFHHYVWLNSHFFISGDNILDINHDTEAVLAKYHYHGESFYLLLVQYKHDTLAKAALKKFKKNYLKGAKNDTVKLTDGRWSGCKRIRNVVFIILNAQSSELVNEFFNKKFTSI